MSECDCGGIEIAVGVKLDDAPSDWAKKVTVKVSKVAFPADLFGLKGVVR